MNIKICDSIMGSGKTSAAIRHMNSDVENRYIFVTPLLTECKRIVRDCAVRHFVEPEHKGNGKLENIHLLLEQKENIVCTHALFRHFTPEILDLIREGKYILILDEVIPAIELVDIKESDLYLLLSNGSITVDDDDIVHWRDFDYEGNRFSDIEYMAKIGTLTLYRDKYLLWLFPMDVFTAFKDVIVMTYLLNAQFQKYLFDMSNITLEYMYTKKNDDGSYDFSAEPFEFDYISGLIDKITIYDDGRTDVGKGLNAVGESYHVLSSSWFKKKNKEKGKPQLRKLKNNIANIFKNIFHTKADYNMWSTFEDYRTKLAGKGYTKGFVAWNARATNDYKHKTSLCYCVNIFHNPIIKHYFRDHGVEVNEDEYALSSMLQWIWRSAIRENKEISIYIPSSRMRNLLVDWLHDISGRSRPKQAVEKRINKLKTDK